MLGWLCGWGVILIVLWVFLFYCWVLFCVLLVVWMSIFWFVVDEMLGDWCVSCWRCVGRFVVVIDVMSVCFRWVWRVCCWFLFLVWCVLFCWWFWCFDSRLFMRCLGFCCLVWMYCCMSCVGGVRVWVWCWLSSWWCWVFLGVDWCSWWCVWVIWRWLSLVWNWIVLFYFWGVVWWVCCRDFVDWLVVFWL